MNCYECRYRKDMTYSVHSTCEHPEAMASIKLLVLAAMLGKEIPNPLNIVGNEHGVKMGWFFWPIDFDPVWLERCDGFKEIEEAKEVQCT